MNSNSDTQIYAIPRVFERRETLHEIRGSTGSPEILQGEYKDDLWLFSLSDSKRRSELAQVFVVQDTGDIFACDTEGSGKVALLATLGRNIFDESMSHRLKAHFASLKPDRRTLAWLQAHIRSI